MMSQRQFSIWLKSPWRDHSIPTKFVHFQYRMRDMPNGSWAIKVMKDQIRVYGRANQSFHQLISYFILGVYWGKKKLSLVHFWKIKSRLGLVEETKQEGMGEKSRIAKNTKVCQWNSSGLILIKLCDIFSCWVSSPTHLII